MDDTKLTKVPMEVRQAVVSAMMGPLRADPEPPEAIRDKSLETILEWHRSEVLRMLQEVKVLVNGHAQGDRQFGTLQTEIDSLIASYDEQGRTVV